MLTNYFLSLAIGETVLIHNRSLGTYRFETIESLGNSGDNPTYETLNPSSGKVIYNHFGWKITPCLDFDHIVDLTDLSQVQDYLAYQKNQKETKK